MGTVALRIFIYSILPLIIAVGHIRLDKSSQRRERKLEIFLLYLFGVGVAGSWNWWLFRSLLHLGLGGRIHRLADWESLPA